MLDFPRPSVHLAHSGRALSAKWWASSAECCHPRCVGGGREGVEGGRGRREGGGGGREGAEGGRGRREGGDGGRGRSGRWGRERGREEEGERREVRKGGGGQVSMGMVRLTENGVLCASACTWYFTPHTITFWFKVSNFLSRNVFRASFLFTSINLRVTSSKESWLWEKRTAASWYLGPINKSNDRGRAG